MKNSKPHFFLSEMSQEELRGFRKFLPAPFNPNSGLHERILDIFEKNVLGDPYRDLSPEDFFGIMYPGQPFNPNYFSRLMSEFQSLILDFIAFNAFRNSAYDLYRVLMQEFNRRAWDHHFPSLQRKALRVTESLPEDPRHIQFRFHYHVEVNEFQIRTQNTSGDFGLPEVLKSMQNNFLLSVLIQACATLNIDGVLGTDYARYTGVLAEQVKQIAQSEYENLPVLVKCYYLVYESLKNIDATEHYRSLLQLLEAYGGTFSKREARDLYRYAVNYSARRLNRGEREFLGEIKDIYRILLDKELFIESGGISPENYKNLVGMLLRIGESEWAAEVLNEYRKFIPATLQEKAFSFNLAIWHFWHDEYHEAREILSANLREYSDPRFGADARGYICKCSYLLGQHIDLESQLEAFRKYLDRLGDNLGDSETSYRDFVRGLRQLNLAVQENSSTRREKIAGILQKWEEPSFAGQQAWLLSMAQKALEQ